MKPNRKTLLVGVALLLAGVLITAGGAWLIWDWGITISERIPWVTQNWSFCYPLFIRCVFVNHWTEPFDIGWGLLIVGMFPLTIGATIIGMFIKVRASILAMRKVIEALL